MIRINEAVEEIVREKPFLESSLAEGLINTSALARQIQPQIEKRLGKSVQTGAIVMAIKRMPLRPAIHSKKNINSLQNNLNDLTVRSKLTIFNYQNSPTLMSCQGQLTEKIRTKDDIFYTYSRGMNESTLVISHSMAETVHDIFHKENLKWHAINMSAITIKLQNENTSTPGLYYQILKILAWQNINISEAVSTSNEFTLIMEQKNINRAFQAFSVFLETKY
jgi:hypothetical protein